MSSMSILVLGAGELGTAILQSLASHAPPTTKISVLLRPSAIFTNDTKKQSSLQALSKLHISFVQGDVLSQSISEIAAIIKPHDLIISALGFVGGPGLQVKLAKAVLEAKVQRYIPWQFGVDYDVLGRGSAQPLFDEQLDVRDLLRAQKEVEWAIISTGIFMSFLFEEFWGVVETNGEEDGTVRALGSWENRVTVTTPEDIGKVTAEVVLRYWGEEKNGVVFVAGETVTYERVRQVVENALDRKLLAEVWSVPFLKEELKKDPDDTLKRYRVVFAGGKGVSWDESSTFNRKRGLDLTGVEAFAQTRFGK